MTDASWRHLTASSKKIIDISETLFPTKSMWRRPATSKISLEITKVVRSNDGNLLKS